MAITVQRMWKVEKIPFCDWKIDYKAKELAAAFDTLSEAQAFVLGVSGEYIKYVPLTEYLKSVAAYNGIEDWRSLNTPEYFSLYLSALNFYNSNRSTNVIKLSNGQEVVYRIGVMHFTWGSE